MKKDDTFLNTIVDAKKKDLKARKGRKPYDQLEQELQSLKPFEGPGFFEALKSDKPTPKIIAEAKKASPSKGVIRADFSLSEINDAYQSAPNIVAISVLTEEDHFGGSDDTLAFFAKNNAHNKPLLRKDFIFEPYQVLESKLLGAQAYLLITTLFDDVKALDELINLGLKIGIEPLVEVHDQQELDMVLQTKARCIGANCRDLKTFSIDRNVHGLLRQLDDSYVRIAESAIDSPEYLHELAAFSDAALVGTEFMRAKDIKTAINTLLTEEVSQ
jgi:indole-3-glycerol phosphate synthase